VLLNELPNMPSHMAITLCILIRFTLSFVILNNLRTYMEMPTIGFFFRSIPYRRYDRQENIFITLNAFH